MPSIHIQENVSLKDYTTIGLGGPAKYFCSIHSINDFREALLFSKTQSLPAIIIGSGSNCIFSDSGFNGIVIHNCLQGIEFLEQDSKYINAQVSSGVSWDDFVRICCEKGYAGIECLSGIPGTTGAVPVQNVGAYGQDVSSSIVKLEALKLSDLESVFFANKDCEFGYRTSVFKKQLTGQYFITKIFFRLKKDGLPLINYSQLEREILKEGLFLQSGSESLTNVRNHVLKLRRKKSMILDSKDLHSRSCGSFFMNPVLDDVQWNQLKEIFLQKNINEIPNYPVQSGYKIPAAFLIEQAGFSKGFRHKGVGISPHHALALVNYNGTTNQLLEFKEMIQTKVQDLFQITLYPEPVYIN